MQICKLRNWSFCIVSNMTFLMEVLQVASEVLQIAAATFSTCIKPYFNIKTMCESDGCVKINFHALPNIF